MLVQVLDLFESWSNSRDCQVASATGSEVAVLQVLPYLK